MRTASGSGRGAEPADADDALKRPSVKTVESGGATPRSLPPIVSPAVAEQDDSAGKGGDGTVKAEGGRVGSEPAGGAAVAIEDDENGDDVREEDETMRDAGAADDEEQPDDGGGMKAERVGIATAGPA